MWKTRCKLSAIYIGEWNHCSVSMKWKEKQRMIKLRISCLSHWNEGRELLFDPDIGWILSLKKKIVWWEMEKIFQMQKCFLYLKLKEKQLKTKKKRKDELIKYEFEKLMLMIFYWIEKKKQKKIFENKWIVQWRRRRRRRIENETQLDLFVDFDLHNSSEVCWL